MLRLNYDSCNYKNLIVAYRLRCSNYKFYDFYNASFFENKQTNVIYIGQLYNIIMYLKVFKAGKL